MDDQILTIAIFDNSFDAECAKARLEALLERLPEEN